MEKKWFRKSMVIGLIVLCIGASAVPIVSSNYIEEMIPPSLKWSKTTVVSLGVDIVEVDDKKVDAFGLKPPQIIELSKGWNLISFYQLPQERRLRGVFREYLNNIDFIRTFEAGRELVYDTHNGIYTLKRVEFDNSYSVHAVRDTRIFIWLMSLSYRIV